MLMRINVSPSCACACQLTTFPIVTDTYIVRTYMRAYVSEPHANALGNYIHVILMWLLGNVAFAVGNIYIICYSIDISEYIHVYTCTFINIHVIMSSLAYMYMHSLHSENFGSV